MAEPIRRLIAEWRDEAAKWQRGIGDNQNTRLLTECAARLEAALAARSILVDRDADMRRDMRAYLDTLTIHGDNIGDIRRSLFLPFNSQWNGWVREDTAARERSAPAAPAVAHTPAESMTLILAQLTPADFARFHAARISYSGSTGPRDTGDSMGPYIATFAFNFVAALTALEWTHPDVRLDGQSLIVMRASIAPTWFCQQCAETFTDTRVAAAHSRHTYHVITSNPDRPSTSGGLADARSEDA